MSNARVKEGNKYTVVVIKQGSGFCLGLLPRGEYTTVGGEVELETGLRGPVVMEDRYLDPEDVALIEQVAGIEAVPIKVQYSPHKVEWADEEEKEENANG